MWRELEDLPREGKVGMTSRRFTAKEKNKQTVQINWRLECLKVFLKVKMTKVV